MWRVHPISEAIVEVPGVEEVPYFRDPDDGRRVCTTAINDSIVLVGTYLRSVSGNFVPRPFVWLHQPSSGLSAGFHDLLTLSGASESEPGYANDISDAGLIVGGRGGRIETPSLYAVAWDLPSYGSAGFSIPLDTAANGSISWSIATAVEKTTSTGAIRIVGTAGRMNCPFHWDTARFALGSTSPTVLALPDPPDSYALSIPDTSLRRHATDVAAGEGETVDFDAGSAEPDPETCDGPPLKPLSPCEYDFYVGAQVSALGVPTWLRIANYSYPSGDPVLTADRLESHQPAALHPTASLEAVCRSG